MKKFEEITKENKMRKLGGNFPLWKVVKGNANIYIEDENDCPVGKVVRGGEEGERIARLFAASEDIYEALRDFVECYESEIKAEGNPFGLNLLERSQTLMEIIK